MVTIVGNIKDYPWSKRIEIIVGKIEESWFKRMKKEFEKDLDYSLPEEAYLEENELYKELEGFICYHEFNTKNKKLYSVNTLYNEICNHINEAIKLTSADDLKFQIVNECRITIDIILEEEKWCTDSVLFHNVLASINTFLKKQISRDYRIILKYSQQLFNDYLEFDLSEEKLTHLLEILFKSGVFAKGVLPQDVAKFAKRHFKCLKKGQSGLQLVSRLRYSDINGETRPSSKARRDVIEKIKEGIQS